MLWNTKRKLVRAILQTFEPSELNFEQWQKYMTFFDSAITKLTSSVENPPIVARPLELDENGKRVLPNSQKYYLIQIS
jgi:hypothetical protein